MVKVLLIPSFVEEGSSLRGKGGTGDCLIDTQR